MVLVNYAFIFRSFGSLGNQLRLIDNVIQYSNIYQGLEVDYRNEYDW